MDIQVYGNIKSSLTKYFANIEFPKSQIPNIVGYEPSDPKYPLIIFYEPRNMARTDFDGSLATISDLGYRFDIYAKTTGSTTKQDLARKLAKHCDEFARFHVGLKQVSWNEVPNEGTNGALYHIIIMYKGDYYEQRLKFI